MAHPHAPGLAALAALLADETRATFCLALLDGRAWTASELARAARVSPPAATEHLNRLVRGGLLAEVRQGRHRYLRLADDRTAHLIEELTAHAPAALAPPRTLSQSSANRALARGRTCYDHLAGRPGVAVTQAMTHRGLLRQDAGFALTDDGAAWLAEIGVDMAGARSSRRPLVLPCLDFTERRPHLAGAVGAALHRHFLARGWVVPVGSGRALRVTDEGRTALRDHLRVAPADLAILVERFASGEVAAGAAPVTATLQIVYLGIFPTALAFSTWSYALSRTTAGKMGATTYVVPVLAVAMSWAFLGAVPGWLTLLGGLLCLAGVAVSRTRGGRRGEKASAIPTAAMADGTGTPWRQPDTVDRA